MTGITPRVKLNGTVRYQVWFDGLLLGEFYTRRNARRFWTREAVPALTRLGFSLHHTTTGGTPA